MNTSQTNWCTVTKLCRYIWIVIKQYKSHLKFTSKLITTVKHVLLWIGYFLNIIADRSLLNLSAQEALSLDFKFFILSKAGSVLALVKFILPYLISYRTIVVFIMINFYFLELLLSTYITLQKSWLHWNETRVFFC